MSELEEMHQDLINLIAKNLATNKWKAGKYTLAEIKELMFRLHIKSDDDTEDLC